MSWEIQNVAVSCERAGLEDDGVMLFTSCLVDLWTIVVSVAVGWPHGFTIMMLAGVCLRRQFSSPRPDAEDVLRCPFIYPSSTVCEQQTFAFSFVNNSRGVGGLSSPTKTGMLQRVLANIHGHVSPGAVSLDSSLPPQPAKCQVTPDENGSMLRCHRLGRKAELRRLKLTIAWRHS